MWKDVDVTVEVCADSSGCSNFLSEVGSEVVNQVFLRRKRGCWRFEEKEKLVK